MSALEGPIVPLETGVLKFILKLPGRSALDGLISPLDLATVAAGFIMYFS